jgi:hypothetical protein
MSQGFHEWPDTPGELLALAVKQDVLGRLEQAMHEDDVIADFLIDGPANVIVDVVIDPSLGGGELSFEGWAADNAPFSSMIGQPAVQAMVTQIRHRILSGRPTGLRDGEEPVVFEIAIHPDAWAA